MLNNWDCSRCDKEMGNGDIKCKCFTKKERNESMENEQYAEDVQQLIDEIDSYPPPTLHIWFGLSYASWLTLPRVLMMDMPKEWQDKMATLLTEYEDTFTNQPDMGTRVQAIKNGRLIAMPEWLLNYRRPDKEMINKTKEPFTFEEVKNEQ